MLWFKRCPRCIEGDIREGTDIRGSYVACLQCGHHLTDGEKAALLGSCLRGVMIRPKRGSTRVPAAVKAAS